jgi:transcriptional regulator with XRE-family HTH domain
MEDIMPQNDRLRQQRILRNWRQQDLADLLGVAPITVLRWESGSHQPGAYYRIKLCKLFGMSAQDLGLVEEPSPPPSPQGKAPAAEQQSSALSDQVVLWTVPYARNPHFTGRDDLLDLLVQRLSPIEAGQPTTIRRAALT